MEERLVELAEWDAGGAEAGDMHVGQDVGLGDGLIDLEQGGLQIEQADGASAERLPGGLDHCESGAGVGERALLDILPHSLLLDNLLLEELVLGVDEVLLLQTELWILGRFLRSPHLFVVPQICSPRS